jgi:NAD(P)-dependent dehydrogenase (short-subunit alcohol dehydrogenase family)
MNGLEDKVAIVAGGAGSIGRAIVGRLIDEGCRVACLDLDAGRLAALGSAPFTLAVDLTDEAAVEDAVEAVAARFGRIDFLVNAPGLVGPTAAVVDLTVDDFERLFRANVLSQFLTLRAVLRRLRAQGEGGAVVNLSSTAAERGRAGRSLYGMTKRAIVGMTVSAALENIDRGVRVNAVSPGPIESEMYRSMVAGTPAGAQAAPATQGAALGQPEHVASMVAFLLSADAAHCNGHVYTVDGGAAA